MPPAWFLLVLCALNLGACVAFAAQRNVPWAMIYFGASLIQAASWRLTR